MTKKTDALILRYGLSVLWQNKYIKTKAVSNIIQLENIIYKELFNKNLKILTIKYRPGFVTVFIYNFCQFFNSLFYQQVIKYYRSVLNLRKVIQKFGVREKYLLWFFKYVGIHGVKLNSVQVIKDTKIIRLYEKKRTLQFFYIFLKTLNIVKLNKVVIYLSTLFYINNFYIENNKVSKKSFFSFKKIRKINGLIKFKLLSIKLENSIFWAYKHTIRVSLNNVFLLKGLLLNYKINTGMLTPKKSDLRFLLYTFVLAVCYSNSKIIVDYLLVAIKKKKIIIEL